MRSGSAIVRPLNRPVAPQDRLEIEVLVAHAYLEPDPRRPVPVADEDAVAKDAVREVGRGMIEDDQVDAASDEFLESLSQVGVQAVERPRRIFIEEGRDVHVAGLPRRPAGNAAEQVDGRDGIAVALEVRVQRRRDFVARQAGHGAIM